MLRAEVIQEWNTLKPKLSKPIIISQHQELIKEALECHLNIASSFTTEYSNEPLLSRRLMEQQKERLTKELEKLTRRQEEVSSEGHREELATQKKDINRNIAELEAALRDNSVIRASFEIQKEKNLQIVKECQELLTKLSE